LHSHGLDPCRHGGGVLRRRPRTQRHRHRRFLYPAQTKAQVLDIAQKTSALVGGKDITADDIVLLEDYAYPVYGVPSKETVEAIRLSARLEGMITDPVYEGKSMQGMIDLVQKGFFPKGSKVLYAHLGGAPALNGYSYTFRNG
jgi:1-aminocyclopropane-1-carboxylate deaminase